MKGNPTDAYKKEEYEDILKELFDDFKKPSDYNNPFKTKEISILETRVKQEDIILNKVLKSPKSTFFFNEMLQNILDIQTE